MSEDGSSGRPGTCASQSERRTRCQVVRTASVGGRLVDGQPAAVEGEVDDRGPVRRQRLAKGRLEGLVGLDLDSAGTAGSSNGGEVDGAQVGRGGLRAAA